MTNMNNVVAINNVPVKICEYNGERVVTFQQIADVHGVRVEHIRNNYSRNAKRFIEGEDTYIIDYSKKSYFDAFEVPPRGLRVFTESGYLLLVKTLTDDTAWEVQRKLIKEYFRSRSLPVLPDFNNPAEAARAWADEYEKRLKAEQEKEYFRLENVAKTEQVNKCVDYIGRQERYIDNLEHQLQNGITLPEFAKRLNGVNVNKVNAWAEKKGWVIRKGKEWKTTSSGRKQQKQYVYDVGSSFINPKTGEQMVSNKVVLTKDGAAKLYREYLKGNLPMLKYWNGEFTHDTYLDSL